MNKICIYIRAEVCWKVGGFAFATQFGGLEAENHTKTLAFCKVTSIYNANVHQFCKVTSIYNNNVDHFCKVTSVSIIMSTNFAK